MNVTSMTSILGVPAGRRYAEMNRYLSEIHCGPRRQYGVNVDEAPPVGTSQGLFHLTEPMPAYAGCYLPERDSPVHTHSFVEIAFAIGGTATPHPQAGQRQLQSGDVLLLRPGVWHGYEN